MFLSGFPLQTQNTPYMVLHIELLHCSNISVRFVKCFISLQPTVDSHCSIYPPTTRSINFVRSASSSADFTLSPSVTPYFYSIFQFFLQNERIDFGRRMIFATDHTKNGFKPESNRIEKKRKAKKLPCRDSNPGRRGENPLS